MSTCYIGLGSNLQEPAQQLKLARRALEQLPHTQLIACSSIYQSRALTLDDEPQNDYLNAVIQLETDLSPEDLLDALQLIENQQGRVREKRWGARTLDLDILLYDECVVDTPHLSIPHKEMLLRDFVLIPLQQIAAELDIPGKHSLKYYVNQLGESTLSLWGEFDG